MVDDCEGYTITLLTETVTGPSIEWMHRHTEARLCLGDALIDHCHQNVPRTCAKTLSYRRRLIEPANSTTMACYMCQKRKPASSSTNCSTDSLKDIAYDIYHLWCNNCDIFICKPCVDTGRGNHRHKLLWTRVVKKSMNAQWDFTNKRSCDRCGQEYFVNVYEGFECVICRNNHCCLQCVQKNIRPLHTVCGGRDVALELQLIRK